MSSQQDYPLAPARSPAGHCPAPAVAVSPRAARWAMLAYLSVPVFGFLLPLAVYLAALRRSRWARDHAARALNLWITVLCYEIAAAIVAAMLALDTPRVAAVVVLPLLAVLWATALVYLIRAAVSASRGGGRPLPRWLCTPLVR